LAAASAKESEKETAFLRAGGVNATLEGTYNFSRELLRI
jgi:hypothetical protein